MLLHPKWLQEGAKFTIFLLFLNVWFAQPGCILGINSDIANYTCFTARWDNPTGVGKCSIGAQKP